MENRYPIQINRNVKETIEPEYHCVFVEPSREKETDCAGEGAKTGNIAEYICPKGHAALSRS
jgi:hypothetical protein